MKRVALAVIILLAVFLILVVFLKNPHNQQVTSTMDISSPAFKQNQIIPNLYTCEGEDMNPPLQISQVPKNTQSLVLILEDPDAPGGTFTHWLIWNLDPTLEIIPENSIPHNAEQGINDSGKIGYTGPCPPAGSTHRYVFRLYALDKKLSLPPGSDRTSLEQAMAGHTITQTQFMALYFKEEQAN